MRISLVSLLILAFPVLAGAQQAKSMCTEPTKPSVAEDEIVLTVCNHTYGMAPLVQPRLYFRLHKSGRGEFEVEPESNGSSAVSNRLVTKEFKIDASEVAEIIKLGQ